MSDTFLCPRRSELGIDPTVHKVPELDSWAPPRNEGRGINDTVRTCSWCGSMHPDDFFAAIERGEEIGPTDKNYKAYVGDSVGKFYFQHLGDEQKKRFVELVNSKAMKIGYPGHFYVLPFFLGRVKP